ncbi:MAG TPA: hypothetical protein VMW35_16750 [Myxococcota bacterium]|jgi:hypothetical protein|nr:hypothetical protein [Myxococcota bacterium]
MAREKRSREEVRAELRRLADVVQREVEAGATSVEEIHKKVAAMPLDALAKLDIFEKTVKDARRIQETSIGVFYDVIRKVNDEVAKLARQMLDDQRQLAGGAKRVRAAAKPKARKTAGSQVHAVRASTHS